MLLRSVPRAFAGLFLCLGVLLFLCLGVLLTGCSSTDTGTSSADAGAAVSSPSWAHGMRAVTQARLPAEARETLALIDQGGPFPYAKDGAVFGNFEGRLPRQTRGYYREYTVRTPGERDRGARRIVTGQGGEIYYTDDHYNAFRAVLR